MGVKWEGRREKGPNRLRFANDFSNSFGAILENIRGHHCINWHIGEEIQGGHCLLRVLEGSMLSRKQNQHKVRFW